MGLKGPSVDQLRRMVRLLTLFQAQLVIFSTGIFTIQAAMSNLWAVTLASILPCVGYYFLYQEDSTLLGPEAWTALAIVVLVGVMGVLAHGIVSTGFIVFHIVFSACMIPALAAWCTAWWFTMDSNCHVSQAAFAGCSTCTCATTNSCTALQLTEAECAGCTAFSKEVCDAFGKSYNKYMLAFTGLAIVVSSLLPLCLDIMVIILDGRQRASDDAKRHVLTVAVDQQTRLLIAGDKPTVTPNTLSDWVTSLLLMGHPDSTAAGERCREALRERGYELPVRKTSKMFSLPLTSPSSSTTTNNAGGSSTHRHGHKDHHSHSKDTLRGGVDDAGMLTDRDIAAAERGEATQRYTTTTYDDDDGTNTGGGKGGKVRRPRRVTPEPSQSTIASPATTIG